MRVIIAMFIADKRSVNRNQAIGLFLVVDKLDINYQLEL